MKVPDFFSRGARPACLTSARAVANRCRVAGLGQDRRGADRGQAVDGGDQLGEPQLVEHRGHSGLGVGQFAAGYRPSPRAAAAPARSAPRRCAITPVGSASAAKSLRTIRRHGLCPPRLVISRRTAVSNLASTEPAGAVQVAAVAVEDHPQRCGPGLGPERPVRCLQRRRPHALEQVTHLAGPGRRASTISRSRRAPRCRSRPQVSSTGSGA